MATFELWPVLATLGLGLSTTLGCGSRPQMTPTAPSPPAEPTITAQESAPPPKRDQPDGGAAPSSPATPTSERTHRQALCDALRRDARPEVEDTERGARLTLKANSEEAAVRLRRAALDLDEAAVPDGSSAAGAAPCELFQVVAEGADIRVTVRDDGLTIDVTSKDRAQWDKLRASMRRFAGTR